MRILSGIQTSGNGELHIGNYLGAVKQWIELADGNEAYYMLANLHAITVPIEPEIARENVYKMAALLIALGLEPTKVTLFVQSQVPEHAQLTWLLNTITYMGEMKRMTQFKDKAGSDQDAVSVGLFDYPVLMAADILLYQANKVPVGEDQRQHIELARNLAIRFNNKFGTVFTVPEPYIPEDAARIMGLDNPTKKMSKSLGTNNYIGLLDNPQEIREKLQKAVTDSESVVKFDRAKKPSVSNLLVIFGAASGQTIEQVEQKYGSSGYGQFKADLAETLVAFLSPVQDKYQKLMADQATLDKILQAGSTKAQSVASETLKLAKEKMGIL